jgi:hypothetical protein
VLTVQQALAAAAPHAEQVILDVKADATDKVRPAVRWKVNDLEQT